MRIVNDAEGLKTLVYVPTWGEHIETTAFNISVLARKLGKPVTVEFCDITMTVNPGDEVYDIIAEYDAQYEVKYNYSLNFGE